MDIIASLLSAISSFWDAIVGFFTDLPVTIFEAFLSAISFLIALIPAPSQQSLQVIFDKLPKDVLWMLNKIGFTQALSILAGGVSFRLLRKLFTLGQW